MSRRRGYEQSLLDEIGVDARIRLSKRCDGCERARNLGRAAEATAWTTRAARTGRAARLPDRLCCGAVVGPLLRRLRTAAGLRAVRRAMAARGCLAAAPSRAATPGTGARQSRSEARQGQQSDGAVGADEGRSAEMDNQTKACSTHTETIVPVSEAIRPKASSTLPMLGSWARAVKHRMRLSWPDRFESRFFSARRKCPALKGS